ncbi:MAG: lysylphosphatidylglycerol synthase transmembrane domain-containing protein [Candidatus Eiseniibacteriota bacterium]
MRRAAAALRLAVGLSALAYLLGRVDFGLARETLATVSGAWLAAAFAAQLGAKVFWLLRWDTLLRAAGHRRGWGHLLRLVLVGLFFNNFLPTSVGGDVARGIGLARGGVPRATAAASVVLDRLVGVLALAVMAAAGGTVGAVLWPGEGPWAAAVVFAFGAAALLVVLTRPRVMAWAASGRAVPVALRGKLARMADAVTLVSGRGRVVLVALAYSLGLSACSALFHWSLARAVAIPIPLLAFFVIVPTVMMFASLPITLNGLGLREVGFVTFLARLGAPTSAAAVFAFLAFALPLVFALAGGLLFVAGERAGSAREEAT